MRLTAWDVVGVLSLLLWVITLPLDIVLLHLFPALGVVVLLQALAWLASYVWLMLYRAGVWR